MHTNLLIHETSPYLLQHAHNPVHWHPWGEEALEKAKTLQKPILVSIGYSACHWCHVMERESFEDEATAAIMNAHFINIKVDREERPDIDAIYMDAVQAISGSGGWPLNVFLTPDAKPFYGGTYFPPVTVHHRLSWKEVLLKIHQAFTERKDEVEHQAENLTKHLQNANVFGMKQQSDDCCTEENEQKIVANILKQADTEWGGFGNAPKFPQTYTIQYLLRHYYFTKDEAALNQALLSLDKMMQGGIYDQIGGGFARYSVDKEWFAPHFEKMLYDNALLLGVYSEALQLTGHKKYQQVIDETILFLTREMQHAEGGFYSALDADSEGVEGKFYTWSMAEMEEVLKEDAAIFCEYYQVEPSGNWEHTNILWCATDMESFASAKGFDVDSFSHLLEKCKQKLRLARSLKVRPGLDDKILLSWNAMLITAFCKSYAATGNENYKQLALDTIVFLEHQLQDKQGNWWHTYKNGKAKITAFLDDYAYLIQAYIHLQEISGVGSYLEKAAKLTALVLDQFQETATGLFFFTASAQTDVLVRKKEVYDGATPSGNAVMVYNLLYLSVVFDKSDWGNLAKNNIQKMSSAIIQYPTSFGCWAMSLQNISRDIKEIVAMGNSVLQTLPKLLKSYLPNKILQSTEKLDDFFPLFRGKLAIEGNFYYLCKNNHCSVVSKDVDDFLANV